jgi:hypothetical protein
MIMHTEWKDIVGFEGYYQVSCDGQVRGVDRFIRDGRNKIAGKILKPRLDEKGYVNVDLSINNIHRRKRVHRLVAEAFIENPSCLPQVNHKDFNKQNNNVDNLEWLTNDANSLHFWSNDFSQSTRRSRQYERNGRAKLVWNDVNLIRKLYKEYSIKRKTLACIFDMSISQIKAIISNRQWKMPEVI